MLLALSLVEAKKVITTPKNTVFTHIPPVGWKQKRLIKYNEEQYNNVFSRSLKKALDLDSVPDP